MSTEKKIANLKKKVAKLSETLTEEIYGICKELGYHNGSRFTYNIDRLKQFNEGLQEFEIINYN
jgi:hypothetical protein